MGQTLDRVLGDQCLKSKVSKSEITLGAAKLKVTLNDCDGDEWRSKHVNESFGKPFGV